MLRPTFRRSALLLVVLTLSVGAFVMASSRLQQAHFTGAVITNPSAATPQEILQSAIDADVTTVTSVPEMLAQIEFSDVWQDMTVEEVLAALLQENLIVGYTTVPAIIADGDRREVPFTMLRSDGLLTALATASGGSIIVQQPGRQMYQISRDAKARLEQVFTTDKLRFLQVFSPLRLLSFFDQTVKTSAFDTEGSYFGYLWKHTGPGPSEVYWDPALPHLGYADHIILRNGQEYPSIPEALNATSQLPAGHKILHMWNLHTQVPNGNVMRDVPYFDYASVTNRSGATVQIKLPWMDTWEETITPRVDEFFRRYKEAGGELDAVMFDQEDYDTMIYYLINTQNEGVNGLNVAPGTVFATIQADPRWPALADKMRARGLTDFSGIQNWFYTHDYRQSIWNAVMQDVRTQQMNRVVYEPIRKHYPDVKFSNYNDFHHNQTVYTGNDSNMIYAYNGIGGYLGTAQQPSLYGSPDLRINYPDMTVDSNPPSFVGISGLQATGGLLMLRTFESTPTYSLKAGDTIRINGSVRVSRNLTTGGQIPFDPYPFTGAVTVRGRPDDHTIVVQVNSQKAPQNISFAGAWGGYPLLKVFPYKSFNAFAGDMIQMRSAITTSNIPVHPTLSAPKYVLRDRYTEGLSYDHYGETLLHAALMGADDFEFWNSTGIDDEGNRYIEDLLNEVSTMVRCADRRVLVRTPISFNDGLIISAVDACGRKIGRMTFNNVLYSGSLIAMKPATFRITSVTGSSSIFTIPDTEIIAPPHEYSPYGYWVTQYRENGPLKVSAAAALRAITGNPLQTITSGGSGATVRPGSTLIRPLLGSDPLSASPAYLSNSTPLRITGNVPRGMTVTNAGFSLGTRRGMLPVLRWQPTTGDVGTYQMSIRTDEGEVRDLTVTVP